MSTSDRFVPCADFLPGHGALGGAPVHHNYKRAVLRPPPRVFTVQVLPATKIGSSYCFGLRVIPLQAERPDDESARSGSSSSSHNQEYDVWRRWEDCLWFQELLEAEYSTMARHKRQRLAAGKGVKHPEGSIYMHVEKAASFESLPPGPDVNSIDKNIHKIIPALSKKGTFFRPSQATVDQREAEFKAMIEALFNEDVPTLVKELRDARVTRDFFGYWTRDRDHERKAAEKDGRPLSSPGNRSARSSIASSAFSMYFSSSNISLQLPGAYDMPPTPAIPSPYRKGSVTSQESVPLSSSNSNQSFRTEKLQPSTTPSLNSGSGVTFTVTDNGVISPASTNNDEGYFGSRESVCTMTTSPSTTSPSSRRWSRASSTFDTSSEGGDSPMMLLPEGEEWRTSVVLDVPNGLQALPEDQELVPQTARLSMTSMDAPPPVRRPRINSLPDRSNYRQGLVFSESAIYEEDVNSIFDGIPPSALNQAHFMMGDEAGIPKSPHSDSSKRSSMALSSFSNRSSNRESVTSFTSVASNLSLPDDRTCASSEGTIRTNHLSIASMSSFLSDTSVDAILPCSPSPNSTGLRRSLSAGSRRSVKPARPLYETDEVWYEEQDELIDAYFYDPGLRPTAPPQEPSTPISSPERPRPQSITPSEATSTSYETDTEEVPPTPGRERISHNITTPERYPKPFQNRPPGQFHLPWSPQSTCPQSPTLSMACSITSSTAGQDSFTIKAVRGDTIVLLRANYSMPLTDIRSKLRDKFASQEGINLSETFAIGYIVNPTADTKLARGRTRSNSTSSVGITPPNCIRYISTEVQWLDIISACTGKLTVRIYDGF
ncbi:hypothetical protein C8Q75DRAFT_806567 [Abortiporus biennis]|nr:hypothetical protein C8Q75DRAFT_806567 [Abortiporus biennis]